MFSSLRGAVDRVTHRRMSFRAFTLIECLVVVGIIAVLAALLFPVFLSIREGARQSSCMSNMRQIGGALRMYAQDWDERHSMNRFGVSGSFMPAKYTWKSAIRRYVKSTNVFRCPSNAYFGAPVEARETIGRSYALNGAVADVGPTDAALTEPSDTIWLCEARYRFPDVYPSEQFWSSFRYSTGNLPEPTAAFGAVQTHGGNKSNFLFFDGHTACIRVVDTLSRHLPLTMWQYSLSEPRNYGSQASFDKIRGEWRAQLLAHSEYR